MNYEAIVIGVSSGGMKALNVLLPALPAGFSLPVIIVQHVSPYGGNNWIGLLNQACALRVKEADEKETIETGNVYVAPANYHLLIERDRTFSLSIDEKVNFARPSIDVLFESAAEVYGDALIGVILTGANTDGAAGMEKIMQCGGLTIVQDPETAWSAAMPAAVLTCITPHYVLPLENVATLLNQLTQ